MGGKPPASFRWVIDELQGNRTDFKSQIIDDFHQAIDDLGIDDNSTLWSVVNAIVEIDRERTKTANRGILQRIWHAVRGGKSHDESRSTPSVLLLDLLKDTRRKIAALEDKAEQTKKAAFCACKIPRSSQ